MEVAEKPPRLAQQGGWASPRARGECRGGAAVLPLANYSHGGGGKNPRGSHNREVGCRLGRGGSAEGEPRLLPLANTCSHKNALDYVALDRLFIAK